MRRMRSEGLWPEKAEEILRSFQEQDRLKVGVPRGRKREEAKRKPKEPDTLDIFRWAFLF